MAPITVEEAGANLPGLLARLPAGGEVVITDGTHPVAKLVAVPSPADPPKPRVPGTAVGILTIMADDDEHLREFAEYM